MAKLLPPASKGGSLAKISKPTTGGISSPLADSFLNTKTKVITLETLFKDRVDREKKSQSVKAKLKEREQRDTKETKLEKQPTQKEAKKKSTKTPGVSFLDKIKNFIGKTILGFFVVRLVDSANDPKIKSFLDGAAAAGDFIIDFGGKIFDGLVTFLDFGYGMYDGLKKNVGDLFGEEGVKQLEDFASSFTKVANYTLITGMAFAGFGEVAANAQKSLIKKVARPAAAAAVKGISRLVGKGAARVVLKGLKLASPVFKKIPIIGPLINFLISYFIFKEPIGKAALRAVGSAIFGAFGAVAGSIVPVIGTAIGGFLGSVAGDYGGALLYDAFFSGKDSLSSGSDEAPDQRPGVPGGSVTPVAGGKVSGNLKGSKEEKWAAMIAMAKKAGAKYPELVAAQFALESNWGTALSAPNNFFGIKATASEAGTTSATQEVYGGVTVNTAGKFKNFATPQDAVNHLVTQWYKDYRGYSGVNRAGSAEEAAELLRKEGYATDPRYAGKLKRLLSQYRNVQSASMRSGDSSTSSVTVNTDTSSSGAGIRNQSEGSKLAGELGRYLDAAGVGGFGSGVHQHPEHPPWPRESGHRPGSLHYESQGGRAIDIGGYGPNLFKRKIGAGVDDQTKIIAAIQEWEKKNNNPKRAEFVHEANDPRGHADHVHIAYKRGGVVPKDLYALLHKGEIVIDPDSAGPAKQMLLAINEANSYEGILKAIRDYAPYDALSQQTVVMSQPGSGSQQMYNQGEGSVSYLPVSSAGAASSPKDILYKGA